MVANLPRALDYMLLVISDCFALLYASAREEVLLKAYQVGFSVLVCRNYPASVDFSSHFLQDKTLNLK